MQEILFVGIGGFIGSALRYKLGGLILHHSENWKFPLSTFLVNCLGCLLIGILTGLIERHHVIGNHGRLFLITGLLGGFTTFSAFGFETTYLLRSGEELAAFLNVSLSVIIGIAAVFLGRWVITSLS